MFPVGAEKLECFDRRDWKNISYLYGGLKMNSLDKILASMRSGKYGSVIDPKGNAHVGIINAIMREDGSGKNWIVTVTNKTVSEQVFIHAT
jgi:hypothetical protein